MASAAKVADCSAKKIPSRVMGSTAPAASPTRYQPGPAIANRSKSPAVNEGIGHEYGSRLAPRPMPVRSIQALVRVRNAADETPASAAAQTPTAR